MWVTEMSFKRSSFGLPLWKFCIWFTQLDVYCPGDEAACDSCGNFKENLRFWEEKALWLFLLDLGPWGGWEIGVPLMSKVSGILPQVPSQRQKISKTEMFYLFQQPYSYRLLQLWDVLETTKWYVHKTDK